MKRTAFRAGSLLFAFALFACSGGGGGGGNSGAGGGTGGRSGGGNSVPPPPTPVAATPRFAFTSSLDNTVSMYTVDATTGRLRRENHRADGSISHERGQRYSARTHPFPTVADVNLASFLDWVVEALDVVLAGLMACGACLALACLFFGGGARRGNDASRRRSHES